MDILVAESIAEFDREEWNRLFPGELEDWSYYRAVEQAGLPEFRFVYFGARAEGALHAVVPAFLTDYELDTTLSGPLRRITDAVSRRFPRLLRQPMLGLGSPVAEHCHLGFAPDLSEPRRLQLLEALLVGAGAYAKEHGARMLAVKDSSAAQDALWARAADRQGLRRQPGLPTASLALPYRQLEDYLRHLSRATRKDLRRKLKAATDVRVEWRNRIDDIAPEIMRLYRATYAQAQYSFEELTEEYFRAVLRELGPRARCATYWLGERLVAFNLVLHDERRLLDKFLGMDYSVARAHNLYFFTWLENVRYALAHGLSEYQSGQGLHREKVRLGSRLTANWLWYRHCNPWIDWVLARIERLARLDRHDPELAALLARSAS